MYIHVIALGKWSPSAEVRRNKHKILNEGQAGKADRVMLNEKIHVNIS